MKEMNKAKSTISNHLGSKRFRWSYPLLIASVGAVVARLTQAEVGAICLTIAIYLAIYIFVPWRRLMDKRQMLARVTSLAIPGIICLVLVITSWGGIVSIFPSASVEREPNLPVIDLIPNPHPTQHLPNVAEIQLTVEPAHGYDSYINPRIVISNPADSPPYCSVTLQLHLTGGFRFYRLEDIPSNFQVKDGYLYSDNMTIDIKDCPSNWVYCEFKIPVYNMDSNTIPGSENQNVSINVTKIRFESG